SNNRRREKQEGRHENGEHRCSEGRRRVEQQLDTNPRKCLWLCLRQWGTRMVMKETQYPYTGPKTQRFLDYVGEIDYKKLSTYYGAYANRTRHAIISTRVGAHSSADAFIF